jgi:hypothetical protein
MTAAADVGTWRCSNRSSFRMGAGSAALALARAVRTLWSARRAVAVKPWMPLPPSFDMVGQLMTFGPTRRQDDGQSRPVLTEWTPNSPPGYRSADELARDNDSSGYLPAAGGAWHCCR